MPKWRNWQTRTTQNRVPFGYVGSIPTFGTLSYNREDYTKQQQTGAIAQSERARLCFR